MALDQPSVGISARNRLIPARMASAECSISSLKSRLSVAVTLRCRRLDNKYFATDFFVHALLSATISISCPSTLAGFATGGHMRQSITFIALLAVASPFALADNFKLEVGANNWFDYGDTTFGLNESVSSEVTLDQTDITMYYQLFDNVVDVDLGFNAKYIDSHSRISGAVSGTETADVSGWVPMVYAGFGAEMPLTGLSVTADGSYVEYQDSTFYDYTLKASYITPWYLGVDVGYRSIRLDLDDFDNSHADVEFDGPFAGASLKF